MTNAEKIITTVNSITAADKAVEKQAWSKLNSLTKPRGSLGTLEECAAKYLAARGDINTKIEKSAVMVFAGDHGVAKEGVSAFPQEVTVQMAANFANGGAAVNVLAKHENAMLRVIDIGVAGECPFFAVINRKIAFGTANMAEGPAMTLTQTEEALVVGIEEAENVISQGADLIALGDMGIANTTPSAALYSVFLDISPEDASGRGTGIDTAKLQHKIAVIKKAIAVNNPDKNNPIETLAAIGGFEIAGICGAILACSARKIPVVIDGFISGAGAVTAMQIKPEVIDYCFFSHLSAESGHANAMKKIGVKPILDLNLRLGEGTGALLASNIIRASLKIIHEMATFESAGVSTAT